MLSRRTTLDIANVYVERFSTRETVRGAYAGHTRVDHSMKPNRVYDFLYERNHNPWLCNTLKNIHDPRKAKDFILRLHTGESIKASQPSWPTTKCEEVGQSFLLKLAEDILNE